MSRETIELDAKVLELIATKVATCARRIEAAGCRS